MVSALITRCNCWRFSLVRLEGAKHPWRRVPPRLTTKIRAIIDALGKPVAPSRTPGQEHDITGVVPLLHQIELGAFRRIAENDVLAGNGLKASSSLALAMPARDNALHALACQRCPAQSSGGP